MFNSVLYGRQQGDDDDTDVCSHVLREGGFKHFIVSDKANGESAQVFFFLILKIANESSHHSLLLLLLLVDFVVAGRQDVPDRLEESQTRCAFDRRRQVLRQRTGVQLRYITLRLVCCILTFWFWSWGWKKSGRNGRVLLPRWSRQKCPDNSHRIDSSK